MSKDLILKVLLSNGEPRLLTTEMFWVRFLSPLDEKTRQDELRYSGLPGQQPRRQLEQDHRERGRHDGRATRPPDAHLRPDHHLRAPQADRIFEV